MYQKNGLRKFVLYKLSDKNYYQNKEIKQMVIEEFGEGTYTEKQVQDLLYNLKKAGKVIQNDSHAYRISNESLKDIGETTAAEINIFQECITNIDNSSKNIEKNLCLQGFLDRYNGIDVDMLNRLYEQNKRIREIVEECKNIMDKII